MKKNNMNKIEAIKVIVQRINVIKYSNDNPASDSLKRVISKQKEILEENLEEAKILEITSKLKRRVWILVNKTAYITDEKEKAKFNEIIKDLEELVEEKTIKI